MRLFVSGTRLWTSSGVFLNVVSRHNMEGQGQTQVGVQYVSFLRLLTFSVY